MADGVIKVSVSANKKNSVTVSSNKNNTEITATADAGRFWAQTAKNWAVSDVLVDNTDYSAKYYAQQSSMSENNAKNHAETTQQIYNQFLDVVDTSTNNFLSTKEEALEDLENAKTESVQEITNLYNSSIDNINTQKTETLMAIQNKSNEGVESIENEANNSLEELISLKSSTLNEVNNTKIEATSSITTLSNDYISQINTTGKSYNTLTNKQITNCILEIPQRIKLELKDGTLTLKAGSVVIVPNGFEEDGVTPKFDYVTIKQDINISSISTSSYTRMMYLQPNYNISGMPVGNSASGSTAPTTFSGGYALWYDTVNNLVKVTADSGLTWSNGYSFPFATTEFVSGKPTSINQVFNGMGYIGSTVWVDKGVKGLIPNGRNEDGTLNNIEYASDRIFMRTFNSTVADSNLEELIFCPFDSSFPYFTGSAIKGNYITNDGFLYNKNTDSILKGFSICFLSRRSGKVTEMIPKQPFRAIDYSDKSEVSGWSMPSSKPIELSWGAFGTEYTAPCNGFFDAGGRINNNGYIALWNKTINLGGKSCSSLDNFLLNAWIFANKGDVVQLQYVNYVSDGGVRFFPCVGCEREV